MDDGLEVAPGTRIDRGELAFSASRASGPGGQNVNKVNSRVSLRFDLDGSPSLDARQKRRLHEKLATRITRDGILHLHAQKHRSQAANRELLVERFVELVAAALRRPKKRKATRPSKAARRRRLEAKRRRSRLKADRGRPSPD